MLCGGLPFLDRQRGQAGVCELFLHTRLLVRRQLCIKQKQHAKGGCGSRSSSLLWEHMRVHQKNVFQRSADRFSTTRVVDFVTGLPRLSIAKSHTVENVHGPRFKQSALIST